mgnify:FL=1
MDIHTGISLFSGIGGLDLGVRAVLGNHRTLAYCERSIEAASVLEKRASEGGLDEAPIYSDVTSLPTELFSGKVDWVIGGFPCQPFSTAGKRKGKDDERNLWPDTIRIIRELGVRYAFLENVPGLVTSGYFGTILGDLAEAGFDAEWGCFTASQVGASHKRERLFILAYSERSPVRWRYQVAREESQGKSKGTQRERVRPDSGPINIELGNPNNSRSQGRFIGTHSTREGTPGETSTELDQLPEFPPGPEDERWGWIIEQYPELAPALCKMHEAEPEVRNVDDAWEIKDRVAALMMLGNAVVPAQAELALRVLLDRAGLTNLSSV